MARSVLDMQDQAGGSGGEQTFRKGLHIPLCDFDFAISYERKTQGSREGGSGTGPPRKRL